jgi:hypothetical protein
MEKATLELEKESGLSRLRVFLGGMNDPERTADALRLSCCQACQGQSGGGAGDPGAPCEGNMSGGGNPEGNPPPCGRAEC